MTTIVPNVTDACLVDVFDFRDGEVCVVRRAIVAWELDDDEKEPRPITIGRNPNANLSVSGIETRHGIRSGEFSFSNPDEFVEWAREEFANRHRVEPGNY